MEKGLVHIYTGNGKGKTTSAIGLGIRAYGRGFKVYMAQFLKSAESGELNVLKNLEPGFTVKRFEMVDKFTWNMNEAEIKETGEGLNKLFDLAITDTKNGAWDMLILDEILGAIKGGFIPIQKVIEFVKNKPEGLELVMTGRAAPEELVALSDYVSEINPIKHPLDKGIGARIGIES
ncbi:MAG TPA: cob(I)yrinic acid a,c-diamide adenosyltransferase [Pseudobacteroides sp.]|uniref:cob(I)yrinic acid a,c-diamide adenosyltransferase n=1 Tax=Pseudobacteroides sp. TaxID=1968840 RepID=UPI002F91C32E